MSTEGETVAEGYLPEYERAIQYGAADFDHLKDLLDSLDYSDLSGHLGHLGLPTDYTKRGVVADALSEAGREQEAELLRSKHPLDVVDTVEDWGFGQRVVPHYPHAANYGGYPVVYHFGEHGDPTCPHCVNEIVSNYPENNPPHSFIHWEGPPIHCTRCSKEIESAYGDPDEDNTPVDHGDAYDGEFGGEGHP